jgi:hypothetical protein
MAFTDYQFEQVIADFALQVSRSHLFAGAANYPPSSWLLETLSRGHSFAFTSEKSRSEFFISPILLEVVRASGDQLSIFSGQRISIEGISGLNGECDYILAKTPPIFLLQAPIISVVEAKRQDIEQAFGQTVAQMVAAQKFNEQHASGVQQVFGCITTGENWQFLRLEQQNLVIDSERYYINELEILLGAFWAMIRHYVTVAAPDAQ